MASQSMGVNKDAKNKPRFREQVASKYIFPGTIRVENDPSHVTQWHSTSRRRQTNGETDEM